MSHPIDKIFQGRIISLAVEEHTLPDGRRGPFEIVRHPGGAAALPVLPDGRVLLLRQFRPAVGRTVIEVPAGKLDGGESPEECIRRELVEETGYRAGSLEKMGTMLTAVGFCDELLHLYLARDLQATQRALEPDEFIEPWPLPLEEALRLLQAGEIPDGKTQILLLRYAQIRS